MNRRSLQRFGMVFLLLAYGTTHADDAFRPLFNGNDLTGWTPVNVAPETFSVRDGMIVSTGKPTGVLRSDKMYENFIMEVEWRHMRPQGNAGIFVWADALTAPGVPFNRGIEVQVLDGRDGPNHTSHGDVFAIHGARLTPDRPHPTGAMRCLPSEKRARPSPEWNHYRIECRDGAIKLAVNGKVVSGGSNCSPRKGYIHLESEGSECHFRNLRIQELPSSSTLSADDIATPDQGFVSMYSGLDLRGWKVPPGHEGHWQARDHILEYDGKSDAPDKNLWTEKEYGDFEMIVDWRFPNKPAPRARPVVLPNGDDATNPDGTRKVVQVPYAGDSGLLPRGSEKAQVNMTFNTIGSGELYGYRTDKSLPAEVRVAAIPKTKADKPPGQWNRFHITMKGDRMTVVLNGQTVIENAELPGIPARGPIGLQHHGDRVQFMNLYIKPLN